MATKPKDSDTQAPTMADLDDAQETYVPAVVSNELRLGVVDGDVSATDIQLPRLSLVYGVGKLSAEFNPGSFVLAGENLLVQKNEPLNVIILQATQYWKEYTTKEMFDNGQLPRSFTTAAEVHEAGGTTEWNGPVGPTFKRAMQLKMLIEQPANVICGLFGVTIGDTKYAPAKWDVDKSAYTRIGPVVNSAARFTLAEKGLLGAVFELRTKSETSKKSGNVVVVPTIKIARFNTDETIAEIKALFAQQTSDQAPF